MRHIPCRTEGNPMDYHSGRLTITADDVARLAALALCAIRQRLRPQMHPTDPAQRLAAAAQHELTTAQQLLKLNHFRAAGAVAGVALELHLKYVACTQGLDVRPYATIAQVQDTLRYAGVLTRQQCRLIGKFAAIRNQCVHARPEPLRRAAVEKLIHGVARLMQTNGQEQDHA
jgi:hypothetical protein